MKRKAYWARLRSAIGGTRMTVRFTAFYLLLIFVPTVVFIGWFSATLARERQMEQAYEVNSMLRQSARFFDGYLRQADFVHGTLQSNQALVDLLSNNYLSSSDELYAYNISVSPAFTGLMSSNSVVCDIGVYRYLDSSIRYSDMTNFIRGIQQFPYDDDTMETLFSGKASRHVEIPPAVTSLTSGKTPPPRIVNLYTLYNSDYSKVIGILEVQVDLNRVFPDMALDVEDAELYLRFGDSCFPVLATGAGAPVELSSLESSGGEILSEPAEDIRFELLIHNRRGGSIDGIVVRNVLMGASLLLIPALLFWWYIYRFASKLLRFSSHIRKARDKGLTSYEGERLAGDEFGVMVSEYNHMTHTINDLIRSVREAEKLKNDANYYAMSSQVNPHFMFNTLENIRMHIEIEEYAAASDMLFILSSFLRYNISLRRESTLFEELDHIRHYLQIYQYRQNYQIVFSIEIDSAVENIECPFCILQPIVENCLKHGMKSLSSKIEILVDVVDVGDGLEVWVTDNGEGMGLAEMEEMNRRLLDPPVQDGTPGGVGIQNVNSRLRYFYGDAFGVSFRRDLKKGLTCVVRMGYRQKRDTLSVYSECAAVPND